MLLALFALNALGLFQALPLPGVAGADLSLAFSSALVFALVLYLSYEANKHRRDEERGLADQRARVEASAQGLKKSLEEAMSETRARVGGLETTVTRTVSEIGARVDGVGSRASALQGSMAGAEQTLSRISQAESETMNKVNDLRATVAESIAVVGERVDALGSRALTIQGGVASAGTTLSKLMDAEREIGVRVDSLEGAMARMEGALAKVESEEVQIGEKLGGFEGRLDGTGGKVSRVEGKVSAIESTTSEIRRGVEGAGAMMSEIRETLPNFEEKISELWQRASEALSRIGAIEESVSDINGRLSLVANVQRRVSRIERGVHKIEGKTAKMTEMGKRLSGIERGVSKIEKRVTSNKTKTGRTRRRTRATKEHEEIREGTSEPISESSPEAAQTKDSRVQQTARE